MSPCTETFIASRTPRRYHLTKARTWSAVCSARIKMPDKDMIICTYCATAEMAGWFTGPPSLAPVNVVQKMQASAGSLIAMAYQLGLLCDISSPNLWRSRSALHGIALPRHKKCKQPLALGSPQPISPHGRRATFSPRSTQQQMQLGSAEEGMTD